MSYYRVAIDWQNGGPEFWKGAGGRLWEQLERKFLCFSSRDLLILDENQLIRLQHTSRRGFSCERLDERTLRHLYDGADPVSDSRLPSWRQIAPVLWVFRQTDGQFQVKRIPLHRELPVEEKARVRG